MTEATRRLVSIGECMVEVSVSGQASAVGWGGDTLNTAIYAGRVLGAGTVGYATALGDDPFSDDMAAGWQAAGLNTDLVFRLAGQLPGLYAIRTDAAGERSFFYWRTQAAARALLQDGRGDAIAAALAGVEMVYLSGITLAILGAEDRLLLAALVDQIRAAGARVAFDSNHRPHLWPNDDAAKAAYEEIGGRCDIALPTLSDETALYGDDGAAAVAARWRGWGCGEVVVKNGAKACLVDTGPMAARVAPEGVDKVIDTTAAGDSFNGAYLAARLDGRLPEAAAALGHAMAGIVIQHRGAIVPAQATAEIKA